MKIIGLVLLFLIFILQLFIVRYLEYIVIYVKEIIKLSHRIKNSQ